MAVTQITLLDPGSGQSSVLHPGRTGVAWQSLQFDPAVRAVAEDRTGAAGSVDTTQFLAAGAVTLGLHLFGQFRYFLDEVGAFLDPGLRPVLIVSDDEWAQARQIMLRFDSGSKPIQPGVGLQRDWALSWSAPNGVWEAVVPTTAFIPAFIDTTTGLEWDATVGVSWTVAGIVWPPSTSPSPSQVTSVGNASSQWTALLYGPCTAPKLANDTAGLTIEFTDDLTLGPGEFVLLSSADQTAYRNGDPGQPVMANLNFQTSDWWLIGKGTNTLRYYPDAAAAGAQAQVTFSAAWLP